MPPWIPKLLLLKAKKKKEKKITERNKPNEKLQIIIEYECVLKKKRKKERNQS